MALLKATQPSSDLSIQALIHRIEQLESRARRGAPQPAQTAPPEPATPERRAGGAAARCVGRRRAPRAAASARAPSGQAATAVAVEEARSP